MTLAPPDTTGLPQKGDLIAGKYRVEEVLGRGGMGVVVAARHLALLQRVAVKFLLPAGLRLPGARERFLREAQAAAAIQSEHVARVLDVGTLETGAPYLVMEYLSGQDLSRLLKSRGPLPIPDAVDLVLQASEAIGEAHALGIVHRDLKPQNLFVITRSGAPFVKVLDFGLSKMPTADGESPMVSLTATDLVVGSPQYMSPEQVRSLKSVDARTDIWALGVILYQLLTGRRPFQGDSVIAICASIVADTPPPLQRYRPDVPAPLDMLVRRCLEKDPARRVQSVAELVQALSRFSSPRASLPSDPRETALTGATPTPSHTSIPAIVAPIPAATSPQERTTTQLTTWAQTQAGARRRTFALVAVAGAVATASFLAIGAMIWLRGSQGEDAVKVTASASASPASSAPIATPEEKKEPLPSPATVTVTAAPTVAPVASASASTVVRIAAVPSKPRPGGSGSKVTPAETTPGSKVTPAETTPPSVFVVPTPAATEKPDAGAAPKPTPGANANATPTVTAKPDAGPAPKTTRELFDRFD